MRVIIYYGPRQDEQAEELAAHLRADGHTAITRNAAPYEGEIERPPFDAVITDSPWIAEVYGAAGVDVHPLTRIEHVDVPTDPSAVQAAPALQILPPADPPADAPPAETPPAGDPQPEAPAPSDQPPADAPAETPPATPPAVTAVNLREVGIRHLAEAVAQVADVAVLQAMVKSDDRGEAVKIYRRRLEQLGAAAE